MADPLDDVRRALGLPVRGPTDADGVHFPQEAGAPPVGNTFDALAAQFDAKAKAHEEERVRLAAAGDDADGLDELRRAFRRWGRG